MEECEEEGLKEMAKLVEEKKEVEFEKHDKAMAQWKEDVVDWGELALSHSSAIKLSHVAEAKHPNGGPMVSRYAFCHRITES